MKLKTHETPEAENCRLLFEAGVPLNNSFEDSPDTVSLTTSRWKSHLPIEQSHYVLDKNKGHFKFINQ